MNELPAIGHPRPRKELRDRQGANTASRQKEMHGEKLLQRPKTRFWREINAFSPPFHRKLILAISIHGKCKSLSE